RGVRGPRGGYRLARERRRITVAEIVRLVDTLDGHEEEAADLAGSPIGRTVVQPLWRELHDQVLTRLETVTIEDLYRQAQAAGVAGAKDADFEI
ncbi:MAG: Rrf2 family transcriptional regulator, partial [Alphaproteobacteria bacterium]|nr:Rrf2 family transcriptional regulator [Alphaproteobacteria bacterium]